MFSSMGQQNKAVEIGRGILTLFKSDGEYSWEEVVVSTMIASAKQWYEIFQSNPTEEDAKTKATKTCLDALNVFKEAPAKLLLKDRSVVFPGYSQLIAIIKSQSFEPPNNQSLEEFEIDLALNFVEETVFQQFNHCRALAMQADMMRKYGEKPKLR